jgi:hypothetical protein
VAASACAPGAGAEVDSARVGAAPVAGGGVRGEQAARLHPASSTFAIESRDTRNIAIRLAQKGQVCLR